MLVTKYLMYIVSIVCFVTLIGAFMDKDVKYLMLLIKIPAWIVVYGVFLSKIFNYCFAHRLPLYYLLSCNALYLTKMHVGGSNDA